MLKHRGIAFKFAFFIFSSCALIFVIVFTYDYLFSRRIITDLIEENADHLTSFTVSEIETVLASVEKVPDNLAYSLEQSSYTKEGLLNLLRSVVEHNQEIYGATIAFEPFAFDKDVEYFAPYYYEKEGKIRFKNLAAESYAYANWDWYKVPKNLNRPAWSEPYYDKGGGEVIMTTYSVPFYKTVDGKKKFMGIVTADIHLSWLHDMISSIKIGETGYGFLISGKGTIITHPEKKLVMNENLSRIAESHGDKRLGSIVKDMMKGKSGFVASKSLVTGKECWMAYKPIPTSGWSLGVLFPRAELMADITNLSKRVSALGLAGILILVAVIVLISGTITRPLRALARSTKDIAGGNLDFKLPLIRSGDEVGNLAASFVYMKNALKRYIRELTETTAAKERMESELKVAHDIQMGIVPKAFPPFPERPEFSMHAVLEPAREVGGDLYDFFFTDDEHLCFVIGDVSGKGVPAALFMAMTITLIKSTAKKVRSPDEILNRINKELSHANDSCMFVTVFCGILNTVTGEVRYANAGHNPPLIARKGKEPEFLTGAASTVAGVDEDTVYTKESIFLQPGDTIYMYTDGLTEAFNRERVMFSEERLKEEVSLHRKDPVKEFAGNILQEVKSFTVGAPQSDDITVLVLRYEGSKKGVEPLQVNRTIILKNDLSEIQSLHRAVIEFGEKHRLPEDVVYDTRLALEEVVSNVIRHGYEDDNEHRIVVRLILEGRTLILEVKDDGRPFNPLEIPGPDTGVPLEERVHGGLGIFLTRRAMDGMEYRREQGQNILIMKKTL
jgi:sigma-B regulation protein RsbU (phosphoserine phosphatase)